MAKSCTYGSPEEAVNAMRESELKTSPQLTLGELILKLEAVENKKLDVCFEFEYLRPTRFDSWRGIYRELALNFAADAGGFTVEGFLAECRQCVGQTFEGYKGGEFVMGTHTPIWVANHGNAGHTAVVDVIADDYAVYLKTQRL